MKSVFNDIILRFVTLIVTLISLVLSLIPSQSILALRIIQWIMSGAAIALLLITFTFDRNFYLRFLNRSVFPTGLLHEYAHLRERKEQWDEKETKAKTFIKATIPESANKTFVYWASKSDSFENPYDAYDKYENSGVARANEKGEVEFRLIEMPGTYKVNFKGVLEPHIHYRTIEQEGMLSEVRTHYL